MAGYMHQGMVRTNGLVDTAQTITDSAALQVRPADDAFRLTSLEVGNFEWWYFDVIDARTGSVLKLVAHVGTDALRTKCYPTVAVACMTPHGVQSFVRRFSLDDFQASREVCDVRIKDAFHAWVESARTVTTYHLSIRLHTFHATLQFCSLMPGWKPLGQEVPMQQGNKRASFAWIVALPRAAVMGTFTVDGLTYKFEEALGYHDHNAWQVDRRAKLFMNDIVAHWYWGRFLGHEYTVVFMDTRFRTHSLRSCLLAKDGAILHSSNNLVQVRPEHEAPDDTLHCTYPAGLRVALCADACTFDLALHARAVLDRRNLLEGVSPLMQWLIRHLISRPSYHGLLADATVRVRGEELHGAALYESMCFRSKGRQK